MMNITPNIPNPENEYNRARFDKFIEIAQNSTKGTKLTNENKEKIKQAAKGFEAIFINFFLKEIKSGLFGQNESMFSGEEDNSMSFGSDTLLGYNQMLFSEHVANAGSGIGIADLIYKNLTGEYLTQNANSRKNELEEQIKNIVEKNSNNLSKTTEKTQDNSSDKINIKEDNNNTKSPIENGFQQRVESRLKKYENIIQQAADKFNIPYELIKAVITAESAGRENAVSKVGAKGLMQLMDGTAEYLGVKNSFDPRDNIFGGSKYLREMLDKFDGNINLALAAYNAGPGNVQKYNGIPPFNETQQYVKKVINYYNQFKNA